MTVLLLFLRQVAVYGPAHSTSINALGKTELCEDFHQVHDKAGQECVRCGTIIEKIQLGDWGNLLCPTVSEGLSWKNHWNTGGIASVSQIDKFSKTARRLMRRKDPPEVTETYRLFQAF